MPTASKKNKHYREKAKQFFDADCLEKKPNL